MNGKIVGKEANMKIKYLIPFLVLVLVFGFTFVGCCFLGDSSGEEKGHDEIEAWVIAQIRVEKNLKSPSTAKFPLGTEGYVTKINDNTFEINAYVDSENSFGAMMRAYFSCTVEFLDDDTCVVNYLEFWE